MNRYLAAAAGWGALALATQGSAQILTFYKVESATASEIGTLFDIEAQANDINNNGAIVGSVTLADGHSRAFYYSNGHMKIIGPLILRVPSWAYGVNDRGEVVGGYIDSRKGYAFFWRQDVGLVRMLDQAYPAAGYSDIFRARGSAINDHAQVAGGESFVFWLQYAGTPPAQPCYLDIPVMWQTPYSYPQSLFCPYTNFPESLMFLSTEAHDINNSGEIAVTEEAEIFKGYVWKDGIRDRVPYPDLQSDSQGLMVFGINESGSVVGTALHDPPGPSLPKKRAIYWDRYAEKSKLLPLLPGGDSSEAFEINDAGFVAGYSKALIHTTANAPVIQSRGILWHQKIGTFQLPLPTGFTPVSTECRANSLNNRVERTGLIEVVGYCEQEGLSRAIRWSVIVSKQTIPISM